MRIEDIQSTTNDTVAEIQSISAVVGENSEIVNTIATAVEEQSVTANEIAKNVSQILQGIQEINSKFARAEVIDTENTKSDKVVFGAIVTIEDQDAGTTATYKIVGVDEADLKKQKIGITSPLARALIGKKEGDEVEVNAPKGKMTYIITGIRYR